MNFAKRMKKTSIFIWIYISTFCAFSQEPKADSLISVWKATKSDSLKSAVLLRLSEHYLYKNSDSARHYLLLAKDALHEFATEIQWIEYYRVSGFYLRDSGQLDSSVQIQKQGLEYINNLQEAAPNLQLRILGKAALLSNLSSLYRRLGDHEEALLNGIVAFEIYDSLMYANPEDRSLKDRYGRALTSMAIIHASFDSDSIAMDYYRQALKFYTTNDFPVNLTYTYFNLGANYLDNKVYDSAITYLTYAKDFSDSLGVERLKPWILQNLSYAYTSSDFISLAGPLIDEFIAIGIERNNDQLLADAYSHKSLYYLRTSHPYKAIKIAESGLAIHTDETNTYLSLHKRLGEAHELVGNYEKALLHWKLVDQVEDSIFNVDTRKSFAEIEAKYQNEKKGRELAIKNATIDILEKDNQIQSLWNNILLIIIVSILVLAVIMYRLYSLSIRRKRERLEASLRFEQIENENQRLKAEELTRELDFKNQKLSSYALNFVQSNETLIEIRESLARVIEETGDGLSKKIKGVQKIINRNINKDQNWDDFMIHFEGVHKGFFIRLKNEYSDLTPNDLRLCALTLLNLNLKESSTIMGISPDSVKTARYRLKKRMGLDKDESMLNHLIKYSQG